MRLWLTIGSSLVGRAWMCSRRPLRHLLLFDVIADLRKIRIIQRSKNLNELGVARGNRLELLHGDPGYAFEVALTDYH